MTSAFDAYRAQQDELLKVQREARKALEGTRTELALAGVAREIAVWREVREALQATPPDFARVVDLLLQAETLEQAKRKHFYL